jgi:hypothetical protein
MPMAKHAPPIKGSMTDSFIFIFAERKAHPPLGARAEVYQGVEVVITRNHRNRTAPSGWMVRLVRLFIHFELAGAGSQTSRLKLLR